ncbi:unnamed protein product [Phytophthora lilii]|uniref:Unnamed protein product n=1 Tax=Phytophthora lilii TaxID=2077276 RepID=A0A9W6X8Q2_9STRA|nr:unnamed protein product [Phytophthora lilii]
MTEEETGKVMEDGGEWTSSRRSGSRTRNGTNRHRNGTLTAGEELRVDARSKTEISEEEDGKLLNDEKGEEQQQETQRRVSSTGSEHSDQLEEPVIPLTVLTSMEAETKTGSARSSGFVPAEHVAGKDEGEETEEDIALLEYLSGAESDYYELDRASRKGEDGENQTPIMSLSPRSFDESLGTPASPGGLLSVDEHGGFGLSPIRYTTVTRRMMAHAQEAPRQASTQVVESPPGSRGADTNETTGTTEAKQATMAIVPRQAGRATATAPESESDWIACEAEDGLTYYYNQRTQESQWTIPASPGVRAYTSEKLFSAVSAEELSETDSRQLSVMLHSGMDLQVINSEGLTPLHVASKMGNEPAAALLVYYGAKLDARAIRDDATPLILACRAESEGVVKLLVESNASLSACDSNGNTALHVAVYTGNEGLVIFVLRGCDHTLLSQKNNEGETALHIAAKFGYFGIVRGLLAYGASAKDEDSQGRTPLILSILENHVECVQLLQSVESNASSTKLSTAPFYNSAYSNDRRQGSGAERDALTVLYSYLFQILPNHSASESQTVYQLVEEVRGQIGALNASLQLELDASRVSHRALASRCELLESIARNAQEKLGRERLEHTRYEESMQEKLHRSLQENANVIESCRQLQATWSERQQQQQYDPRLGRRDSQGFYEISEDLAHLSSVQESIGENYHLLETDGSTSMVSGNQSRERASSDYYQQQGYSDGYRNSFEQYQYDNAPEISDVPPPLLDDPDQSPIEKGESTASISPARVGAVWNRFFENVGHASESREQKSYKPSSFGGGQPAVGYPSGSLVFDAVRKNELQKLQDVLLRGVSPNQRDVAEKGTPLHLACELGDIDAVMLLSEFGAELEARDEAGNPPLLAACFQGNFECVKFLLQSAVSLSAVNENGDSALHLAAWDGSISCVMILREYGVDPMATNRFGLTALGNMKTRSPMRHKFDDLPEDHPMRRTLLVLEEAERHRMQQVIEDQSTSTENATEHQVQPPKQADNERLSKRSSWTVSRFIFALAYLFTLSQLDTVCDLQQWLLGFRGPHRDSPTPTKPELDQQKGDIGEANTSTTATDENEGGSDADDFASYEESRLMLSEMQYEPLTPPPEIEEALRRAKAIQRGAFEPPSPASAATHPVSRHDLSKHVNLSPSVRSATKPHPPAAPTKLRARYVDTFNTP